MVVDRAYSEAALSGLYAKPQGLRGKYDNVRRFWEDEVTRRYIRCYLQEQLKKKGTDKVRIMDIGCGCGDGYDLLGKITAEGLALTDTACFLLPEERIEEYTGVDINLDLLEQGQSAFCHNPQVSFKQVNFLDSLGLRKSKPYDIFLANYGTLSHCKDEEVVRLLCEIADNSAVGTLFIGDWLGSYCYEWHNLWSRENELEQYIDYRISYIYDPKERQDLKLDSFPLRLMQKKSLQKLITQVNKTSQRKVIIRKVFDRSIFIGRHMETTDYKASAQPIRTLINSLLEPAVRTDLGKLYLECEPVRGFDEVNRSFGNLQQQWNQLISYVERLLEEENHRHHIDHFNDNSFLSTMMEKMNILIRCTRGLALEDVRANIIEPQLAYMLRDLEMNQTAGIGMGHGFGMILEIK